MRRLAIALIPLFLFDCHGEPAAPDGSVAVRSDLEGAKVAGANGPTQVTHWIANGPFADASYYFDGSYYRGFNIGVYREGTTNNPSTYLYFGWWDCDESWVCDAASGGGLIPNQDFTTTGPDEARLSTHVANSPDFWLEVLEGGVVVEGVEGEVVVTWRGNGHRTLVNSGIQQETLQEAGGTFTRNQQGRWTARSAWVTGTILGNTLPTVANASIGTNHTVMIDILR